jgi:hypothetical protein
MPVLIEGEPQAPTMITAAAIAVTATADTGRRGAVEAV